MNKWLVLCMLLLGLIAVGCEDSAEEAAGKSDDNALIVRNHYTQGGDIRFRGHSAYVPVGDYHVFVNIPPGEYEVTFETRSTPGQTFRTTGTVVFEGHNETKTVRVEMFGIQ